MIDKFLNHVNGLKKSRIQPVSFSLHKDIGNILNNDTELVNNAVCNEKAMANPDNISLLP